MLAITRPQPLHGAVKGRVHRNSMNALRLANKTHNCVRRTRTAEGDPGDDKETVVEGDVTGVRLRRPDSQPEPESNATTIHNAASRSTRLEIRDPTAEPCEKVPRRAEAIERDVDQVDQRALIDANRRPANAIPSDPPSTSAAAANDDSSGERLYMSMTEGDIQETTAWPDDDAARSPQTMGTDEERTMTIQEAREARRNCASVPTRLRSDF